MNSRSVGIFAVVVAILVGASVWFLYSDRAPHYTPQPEPTPAPAKPPGPKATDPGTTRTDPNVVRPDPGKGSATVTPPRPAPAAMTEDDRKIDEALRMFPGNTEQDHTNTAQALINLLPTLTADGQVECAQHVSNLLSDEQYNRVLHIWRNPSFNPEVIEVFATDLMNREHKVMLPAMLDAVRMPNHPFHEEAKTTLEVFLDEDFGNDVPKWEKAMKDYLKKEAEEEAGTVTPPAPGQ
jgi:hypothetical protein